MAKVYWRTIKNGVRTLADVPNALQAAVRELARMDVAAGVITKEQYEAWMGEPCEEET